MNPPLHHSPPLAKAVIRAAHLKIRAAGHRNMISINTTVRGVECRIGLN